MSQLIVRKVAVLGAGVMGAQIAAHLVSAKVSVILFDLPAKEGSKNAIAEKAIANLAKLKPSPLAISGQHSLLEAANYEDDLEKLRECDLIIEAIAERMDWKHALYQKVAPFVRKDAVLTTNTSGLSITQLADVMDDDLKSRFCGIHFFNPPRYLHLLEIIPTQYTRPEIVDQLETFGIKIAGKGVIRAKDTPNFVANRIGVFGMLAVMHEAEKYGISYDLVDDLTGSRLGRAKSATFRTADVVGLDTLSHVVKTMEDNLPNCPFKAIYQPNPVIKQLIEKGILGQKTGYGFYKKEGNELKVLDGKTMTYVPAGAKADETVGRILKKPANERLRLLRESTNPQAQFLWAVFRDLFHYCAVYLESVADNARTLDLGVRWGFFWSEGPFESWQAAGWSDVAKWIQEDIDAGKALCAAPLPAWVTSGPVADKGGVHTPEGSWNPAKQQFEARSQLPVYEQQVFKPALVGEEVNPLTAGTTVVENEGGRLWVDASYPDVLICSFKSKMNTIGPKVLEILNQGVELAEKSYKGMVVWQPTSLKLGTPGGPFSAGADLESMMPAFMSGGPKALVGAVESFQNTMMRVKYAQVPVVAALSGIALGGGCELALHASKRVAAMETFMGLVEIGVGLVPGGGGLKEAALRAAMAAEKINNPNKLAFLQPWFENIAMAKVSGSALEAQKMGYLTDADTIIMNVHELLAVACAEVRTMNAAGYRPPIKGQAIPAAGRSVLATIKASLVGMRDGGFISAYDYELASKIALVMCGGEIEAGTPVNEDWYLAQERKAFVECLANPKTQERIMGFLQTGKPVRN